MPTIELITLLLQAAAQLAPNIKADFQSGIITNAQQAALQAALQAISVIGFSGPEWQPRLSAPIPPVLP